MKTFNKLQLDTNRLHLRPLVESDQNVLFSIYADPTVMEFWSTPPWSQIEDARTFILKDIEALKKGRFIRLGIEIKHTRQLIGNCSLFNFNWQSLRAEIGYILSKHFWGQGLMREALIGLIAYAFRDLELHRLEADIDPRNNASVKLLEGLGFSREGYLRERWIVSGEISDSALYGLLRREWEAKDSDR